jgi:hypothetical protein
VSFVAAVLVFTAPAYGQLPDYAKAHTFSEFPVPVETVSAPASPQLTSPEARRYRTQIRKAAREGVNFAGHLRVATWGCGTCCQQFAIINLKSGLVWMPRFAVACGCPMDKPPCDEAGIYFLESSSLLVVVGSRDEGPRCGVYYFKWTGKSLRFLRAEAEVNNECGA